ncbi:hypothetical protein LTR29_010555 [Friedmanniomyces endolithicus]|nr:hypothetical protein LTR29_010555 [Friedmanniomyces endolithicus]
MADHRAKYRTEIQQSLFLPLCGHDFLYCWSHEGRSAATSDEVATTTVHHAAWSWGRTVVLESREYHPTWPRRKHFALLLEQGQHKPPYAIETTAQAAIPGIQ